MSLAGRLQAWTNLAWRMAVHVATRMPARAFGRTRDMQRFRDAVEPEGFLPLLPAERDAFPRFMRCVHCGLCAIAADEEPATAWDEAWTFVAGPSRSLDRAGLVAARIPATVNRAADAVCPMSVPISLMGATLHRLGTAAASPAAPSRPDPGA